MQFCVRFDMEPAMYCLKLRLSSLSIYRVSVHEEALSDYMCVRMRVNELSVASAPLSNVLCVQAPRGGFLDGAYNMRNHYRSLWLEHKQPTVHLTCARSPAPNVNPNRIKSEMSGGPI